MHKNSIQQVIKELGVELCDPEYFEIGPGRLTAELFEDIFSRKKLRASVEECVKKKRKYYEMLFNSQKPRFFPGVKNIVIKLFQHHYKLGLASATQRIFIATALEILSLKDSFCAISSSEDVKRGKPDPELYLLTAKRLGLATQSCVAIEDSVNGIKAAKICGMKCIAITNTFPESALSDADMIINSLDYDLEKILVYLEGRS